MERVQDVPTDRIDKWLPNPILQDHNSFTNTTMEWLCSTNHRIH